MRFIETPIFTKELQHLLEDEEYRALQLALLFRPEQGGLIPGPGVFENFGGVKRERENGVAAE